MKALVWGLSILLGLATSACSFQKSEEEQISECVDSFAVNYFNWHYAQAAKYCSKESKQWLQFVASQVAKDDIDILRNKKTALSVEIDDVDFRAENKAIVHIYVNNYIALRSFGDTPQEIERGYFELFVIKTGNRWQIKMEALPRSEMRNPDRN